MAKQDLVVKLLLDSGAFGNDLRQAERKAQEFSNKMRNAGDTVGSLGKEVGISTGALGKLGTMLGAGGAVVAAVGAFKSVMESTSGTAVQFQSTIAGFQGVLDTFQTSLATFDFSNFNDGLLTVFKNAKNVKQAIANMNFGSIAYDYLTGGYKADLKKYKSEFTSTETTEERREEITTLTNETLKDWDTSLKKQKTNIITAFRSKMKHKDNDLDIGAVSETLAEQWMKEAASVMLDPDAKKEWENRVKKINKDINKYNRQSGWNDFKANLANGFNNGDAKADFDKAAQAAAKEREKLIKKHQKDLFINEIFEMNEKELTEAIKQLDEINRLIDEYYTTEKEARDSMKTITTTKTTKTTGGGGGKKAPEPETGSIAYWKNLISQQTQLKDTLVVGTDKWWAAVNAIKAYTEELDKLLLMQRKLEHPMEKLPELANIVPPRLTAPDMGLALPKGWRKEGGLFIKGEEEEAIEKRTKDYEGLNDVLSSTVFLFDALGSSIEDSGDKSSQNAIAMMNIFSAIAEGALNVIPALQALTAAEGTAQAAKVPWPANIAAILSIVATVTSVFASIKNISGKFAEGGIVGGTSYSGDKLFAMVNSGEMILNKRQQGNLANMIGGGGQVEFHISGDSLVGVLNNKNRKTNLTR